MEIYCCRPRPSKSTHVIFPVVRPSSVAEPTHCQPPTPPVYQFPWSRSAPTNAETETAGTGLLSGIVRGVRGRRPPSGSRDYRAGPPAGRERLGAPGEAPARGHHQRSASRGEGMYYRIGTTFTHTAVTAWGGVAWQWRQWQPNLFLARWG